MMCGGGEALTRDGRARTGVDVDVDGFGDGE